MSVLLGIPVYLSITGCCTQKDKQRVDDIIDKFEQRMTKNCERIQDQTQKDQCFADLNGQLVQLATLQIAYYTACDNGETELIKDILRQIRTIVGGGTARAAGGSGTSQTGIHNENDLFGYGDTILLSIIAEPTGKVAQVKLAMDSGGKLMSGSASLLLPPENDGSQSTTPVLRDAVEYSLSPSTVTLLSDGTTWETTISGTISLAWNDPGPDGSRLGVPTSGVLRAQTQDILDTMLVVDDSIPEAIVQIDANGDGLLALKALVSPLSLPSSLLPNEAWFELPIHYDDSSGTIEITTGTNYVDAEQIAPRAPFPVADADDNMLITDADLVLFTSWLDAGDPRADANRDGFVNSVDLDYFLIYWDYEIAR